MKRIGLGAVVVLVAVISVWLSRAALWGQAPQVPPGPVARPTHSIKITLYEKDGVCRLAPIADAGFYPEDPIVWNVENGCSAPVKITIQSPRHVGGPNLRPFETDIFPQALSVVARSQKSRTHVSTSAAKGGPEDGAPPSEYEYDVEQNAPSGTTIKGRLFFCREPPCR
jgi:hypothetical protein